MEYQYLFNLESAYYDKERQLNKNGFVIITSKTPKLGIDLNFNVPGKYCLELELKTKSKKISKNKLELEIINAQNQEQIKYYNPKTYLIKKNKQWVFYNMIDIDYNGIYYFLFRNTSSRNPIGIRKILISYCPESHYLRILHKLPTKPLVENIKTQEHRHGKISYLIQHVNTDQHLFGGYWLEFSIPDNPSETIVGLDFQYGHILINQKEEQLQFALYNHRGQSASIIQRNSKTKLEFIHNPIITYKTSIKPNQKYQIFVRVQRITIGDKNITEKLPQTFFSAYFRPKSSYKNFEYLGTLSIPTSVKSSRISLFLENIGYRNGHLYKRYLDLYQMGVFTTYGSYLPARTISYYAKKPYNSRLLINTRGQSLRLSIGGYPQYSFVSLASTNVMELEFPKKTNKKTVKSFKKLPWDNQFTKLEEETTVVIEDSDIQNIDENMTMEIIEETQSNLSIPIINSFDDVSDRIEMEKLSIETLEEIQKSTKVIGNDKETQTNLEIQEEILGIKAVYTTQMTAPSSKYILPEEEFRDPIYNDEQVKFLDNIDQERDLA